MFHLYFHVLIRVHANAIPRNTNAVKKAVILVMMLI